LLARRAPAIVGADEKNVAVGALHLPQHSGIIVVDPPVDAGMICLTKSGS
jgi:hypothetical protein